MKKKKKLYYDKNQFVVSVDMFRVEVVVLVNGTDAENKKWLKKICGSKYEGLDESQLEDWETDPTNEGRMIQHRGGYIVLLKFFPKKYCQAIGTLTHEMTHVASYLLRRRRIPLSEDTEEVYAYLTEHLVSESLRRL